MTVVKKATFGTAQSTGHYPQQHVRSPAQGGTDHGSLVCIKTARARQSAMTEHLGTCSGDTDTMVRPDDVHHSASSRSNPRAETSLPGQALKRCVIYTRKSSDEGLEQDFNSLDAQREACAAYVQSQRHEGWRWIRKSGTGSEEGDSYDDGGLSGGTMDRPGLQRLLAAIQRGEVDVVVVYKVDRLTRSLADFARIVDVFDKHGVSFVSVTQSFNTTSSMGRLTLNVLLSFAQFEREVTAERIRDKIAASKKKGIWMGGRVPLGYRVENRKLLIDEREAKTVQHIFQTYAATRSLPKTKAILDREGLTTRCTINRAGKRIGGNPFSCSGLSALLRNPIYIGKLPHKGIIYEGEHQALVSLDLFEAVQSSLNASPGENRKRSKSSSEPQPGRLLKGLLFDSAGFAMTPTHSSRNGVRSNYYVSTAL